MKRQPVQVVFAPPASPTPSEAPAITAIPQAPEPIRKPKQPGNANGRIKLFVLPPLIYTLCYLALTFPNILSWRTRFFCDWGDGLQNVWNLWWVNFAVTKLHTSPWFTTYLHFPQGTSLLGHTLNPLNGFLSIPLQTVFSLAVTHNLIEVFCFAASGTTMFWLARKLTESFWPSVIAGYAFTFSAYHWAHAPGHMQLISMEWIPLFLLMWVMLLDRPRWWIAVIAACVLAAVELCDFYYLFYCVIAGVILFIAEAVRRRSATFFLTKPYLIALGSFVGLTLLLCAPLPIALLRLNAADPLQGAHPADLYYTDLFAPIVPSAMWRWGWLTEPYWTRLHHNSSELSVSLGVATFAAAIYAVAGHARRQYRTRQYRTGTWFTLAMIFFILAMGRRFHVCGKELTGPIMPYRWLEKLIPPMELSGCPSRMMVITTLATSLLAAIGINAFLQNHRRLLWPVGSVFLLLLIIESIPTPMPTMPADAPDWATRLAKMPGDDVGVMYIGHNLTDGDQLFDQTVYQKPTVNGYIARIPTSVLVNLDQTYALLIQHRLPELYHQQKVRYLVTDATESPNPDGIIYEGPNRRIYDLSRMVP